LGKTIIKNSTVYLTTQAPAVESGPWNGEYAVGHVVKEVAEQRYTLTVAYPVNKPDVGIARDGHKDFAGPEAIEKAAWSYLRESPKVGQWHEDGTEGVGDVVESYIWRFPDQVIKAADGSDYTITRGDWLLGVVWNEEAWNLFKSGEAKGVSMQGKATRRTPSPLDLANLRKNRAR
jgi:Putative phage serine protease XkdF